MIRNQKTLGQYTGLPVSAFLYDPYVRRILLDLLSGGAGTPTFQDVTNEGSSTNVAIGIKDPSNNVNIALEPNVSGQGNVTVREAPFGSNYTETKMLPYKLQFRKIVAGNLYITTIQPSSGTASDTFSLPSGVGNATIATMQSQRVVVTGDYGLSGPDCGKVIIFDSATPVNCTIPSGLSADFNCLIVQKGVGAVTFVGAGATIENADGYTKTGGQRSIVTIVGVDTNLFYTSGKMSA